MGISNFLVCGEGFLSEALVGDRHRAGEITRVQASSLSIGIDLEKDDVHSGHHEISSIWVTKIMVVPSRR